MLKGLEVIGIGAPVHLSLWRWGHGATDIYVAGDSAIDLDT
jgi:hypothetical protein